MQFVIIIYFRPTIQRKQQKMSENKQIILSVLYIDHFAWILGASPGEVVDQIQEVECHQEEGKHKE